MMNSDFSLMNKFIDNNAVLKGHFVLSSGLHSDTYIQCAKIFEKPSVAMEICYLLAEKVSSLDFSVVLSPAIGGITVGYEIARQLKKDFIFCERVSGEFVLRRGFKIQDNVKILIVEDVITTGKSCLEAIKAVCKEDDVVAIAALVKRNDVNLPINVVSLLDLNIKNYKSEDVPESLSSIPISSPGSRHYSSAS